MKYKIKRVYPFGGTILQPPEGGDIIYDGVKYDVGLLFILQ